MRGTRVRELKKLSPGAELFRLVKKAYKDKQHVKAVAIPKNKRVPKMVQTKHNYKKVVFVKEVGNG